jgi:hypothetical protein
MIREPIIDIAKQALRGEMATPIGRINLVFGVIAVVMVVLLWTGSAIEQIGEFILKLFDKQGQPTSESDKTLAIISVLVFFVISLIVVALAT